MLRQQQKVKNPKAVVSLLAALLLFAGVIILFTIGGVFFSKEKPRVNYYENTICQVDSRSYRIYQCKSRYVYYPCYSPIWYAHFSLNSQIINTVVEQDQRYDSYRDAIDKANEYAINGNYSCWYDTRNPTISQWDRPSLLVSIILLCSGGLSFLLSILFCFLTYRFIKEKQMQMQMAVQPTYDFPPSFQSIYNKQ